MKFLSKLKNIFSSSKPKVQARYEAVYSSDVRSKIHAPARSATRDVQQYTRKRLLEKSRYFYKNSPTYAGTIERLVDYVVGIGHYPRAKTSSAKFNEQADAYFKQWCESVCFANDMDFLTFQNVVARTIFVDGDVASILCVFGNRPFVQLVEGHLITDKANTDWDKPDGVELRKDGTVKSYKVATDDDLRDFENVDKHRLVLHFYPTRPSQYRGVPVATSALLTVHDLDDILALEKQAVKSASARPFAVKTPIDSDDPEDVFKRVEQQEQQEDKDKLYEAHLQESTEQAHSLLLRPGEDIIQLSNDRPGPAWQGFVDFLSSSIAFSTGFPISIVLGNKVGGADTRRELATADRALIKWQNRLCHQLKQIYCYVIKFACARGFITEPRPDDWQKVLWQHPPRATVDLGREASTDKSLVEAGLMSLEDFFAKNGKNWRDVVEQIAIEKAYIIDVAKKFGISEQLIFDVFKNVQHHTPLPELNAQAKKKRCKPNQCVHQWAKNAQKRRRIRKAKKQVFPEGFRAVKKQDTYKRISGDKSETITGSDGKPSTFSQVGINHFDSKKKEERNNRLRSLDIAQDTVKTGLHFESLKEGKPQTEFIKSYNDTFFYTARRDEDGMVYTWHEIREEKYNKKLEAYKAYVENETIQ